MKDLTLFILMISVFFGSLLSFYAAIRVQRYRGIALVSRSEGVFSFLFFIVQFALPAYALFEENFNFALIIIIIFALTYKSIKIYSNGRVIVIYDTSKDILVERVRSELIRLKIPFKEQVNHFSDLHEFFLADETVIKVSSPWGGEKEFKTFQINFIKWWRLYHYEEIKNNVIELYREERENKIFWKQIFGSASLCVILIGFIIFVQWKYSPFQ